MHNLFHRLSLFLFKCNLHKSLKIYCFFHFVKVFGKKVSLKSFSVLYWFSFIFKEISSYILFITMNRVLYWFSFNFIYFFCCIWYVLHISNREHQFCKVTEHKARNMQFIIKYYTIIMLHNLWKNSFLMK